MIRTSLAALTLLIGVLPALAAPLSARASYVLTLGGINVATMDVDLSDDGDRYELVLSAKVAGLGTLVSSGTAEARATGLLEGERLTSSAFNLETRANGEVFTVDVSFVGQDVSTFKVEPPILDTGDRVPLERGHLNGVGDFLSAFVLKGQNLDESLCARDLRIFTGVERFNIVMSYAGRDDATSPRTGYQGPVVLCRLDYQPISGHFANAEMTDYLARTSNILIWYAPLGQTGYYVPYRVLLGTAMGDLSMVLVGMRL